MANDTIEFKGGVGFVLEGGARERINALLRSIGASGEKTVHELLAQRIIGPIKQIADYTEWTKMFYQSTDIGNPALDVVRIAVDNPSMIALYTSPTGGVEFVRPGRTTYLSPSFKMVDAGLEIGWDDMASAGWDILSTKIKEVGEELARKRDEQGLAILDAACAAVTDHAQEVSGGAMTKAAVDAIFKDAADAKWPIRTVVCNAGDIMDMGGWTLSSNSMFQSGYQSQAQEVLKQFYFTNYGGANWFAFAEVPAGSVYFAADPATCGAFRWRAGGTRTASDINIVRKTDLHTWDEKWGHYWGNPYSVWKLSITA